MHPTTTRVIHLIKVGTYTTHQGIADEVGISRERVRQIIQEQELSWTSKSGCDEWDCPGCGIHLKVPRYQARHIKRMPKYCKPCRDTYNKTYCIRGHLKSLHSRSARSGKYIYPVCGECMRVKARSIVESRICQICHNPLRISHGTLRQIKYAKAKGLYHSECYKPLASKLGWVPKKNHDY